MWQRKIPQINVSVFGDTSLTKTRHEVKLVCLLSIFDLVFSMGIALMIKVERRIGIAIKKLSNQYVRFLARIIARVCENIPDVGVVTRLQGWIISFLYHDRGKRVFFQKDIEKEFNIQRSTATKALQIMERDGWLTRHATDEDARWKAITLTPKAIDYHRRVEEGIVSAEEIVTEGITQAELDTFFAVIDKITRNIS